MKNFSHFNNIPGNSEIEDNIPTSAAATPAADSTISSGNNKLSKISTNQSQSSPPISSRPFKQPKQRPNSFRKNAGAATKKNKKNPIPQPPPANLERQKFKQHQKQVWPNQENSGIFQESSLQQFQQQLTPNVRTQDRLSPSDRFRQIFSLDKKKILGSNFYNILKSISGNSSVASNNNSGQRSSVGDKISIHNISGSEKKNMIASTTSKMGYDPSPSISKEASGWTTNAEENFPTNNMNSNSNSSSISNCDTDETSSQHSTGSSCSSSSSAALLAGGVPAMPVLNEFDFSWAMKLAEPLRRTDVEGFLAIYEEKMPKDLPTATLEAIKEAARIIAESSEDEMNSYLSIVQQQQQQQQQAHSLESLASFQQHGPEQKQQQQNKENIDSSHKPAISASDSSQPIVKPTTQHSSPLDQHSTFAPVKNPSQQSRSSPSPSSPAVTKALKKLEKNVKKQQDRQRRIENRLRKQLQPPSPPLITTPSDGSIVKNASAQEPPRQTSTIIDTNSDLMEFIVSEYGGEKSNGSTVSPLPSPLPMENSNDEESKKTKKKKKKKNPKRSSSTTTSSAEQKVEHPDNGSTQLARNSAMPSTTAIATTKAETYPKAQEKQSTNSTSTTTTSSSSSSSSSNISTTTEIAPKAEPQQKAQEEAMTQKVTSNSAIPSTDATAAKAEPEQKVQEKTLTSNPDMPPENTTPRATIATKAEPQPNIQDKSSTQAAQVSNFLIKTPTAEKQLPKFDKSGAINHLELEKMLGVEQKVAKSEKNAEPNQVFSYLFLNENRVEGAIPPPSALQKRKQLRDESREEKKYFDYEEACEFFEKR